MRSEIEIAMEELGDGWVEFETQGADFSDRRLEKRYSRVLSQMSRMPQSPFTQSSEDLSEMLGAYRFIENRKVTVEKLLQPHREQMKQRASGEDTVLLIQDTTYFDFCGHDKCEDLKPLKIKRSSKVLWLHATVCVLPNGRPLGIADTQYLSGKTNISSRYANYSDNWKPIEEKQSERWLNAVDRCEGIFPESVRRVWICDQEADIYELLSHIKSGEEDYVVRSRHPRNTENASFSNLFQLLDSAPVRGHFDLVVSGKGKRTKRTAKMAIKFESVTLCAPEARKYSVAFQALPTYVVEVSELDPPPGQEPLHWRLLTSIEIDSLDDALKVIGWYQKRWAIEEIFRVLKSGCRAEQAQFHTTERISKYLTLSILVAWRLYFLVHINRLNPDAPASDVLTEPELRTLQLLLDDRRLTKNKRKSTIRTAGQAIHQIALLGGHLDKRNGAFPGVVVLWRGTMALAFSTMTFLAQQRVANS